MLPSGENPDPNRNLSAREKGRYGLEKNDVMKPNRQKCPHCGEEIPDLEYDAEAVGYPLIRWNKIAERFSLRPIQKMNPARIRHLACRLDENPDFWSDLENAVARRGPWAMRKKFPTFDQAVAPALLQKLLEGNYDGEPGEVEDAERQRLIARLISEGWQGAAVATPDGLEAPRGVEAWSGISTERLHKMLDHDGIEGIVDEFFRGEDVPRPGV